VSRASWDSGSLLVLHWSGFRGVKGEKRES